MHCKLPWKLLGERACAFTSNHTPIEREHHALFFICNESLSLISGRDNSKPKCVDEILYHSVPLFFQMVCRGPVSQWYFVHFVLHGFLCPKIGPTQPLLAVVAQGTFVNKKTIQSKWRCWNQTNLQSWACNSGLIIMALRSHWLLCH